MDFIEIVNQLGKIAGKLSFEPVWKPYDGKKPVWIACEGLTLKDARMGYKWCENLLQIAEAPYSAVEAWNIETVTDWNQLTLEPAKHGVYNLLTLGAPLFRLADKGLALPPEKEVDMEGFYKIICYSANYSHLIASEDKGEVEADLVQRRKAQKKMLWQNAGDFDLQLQIELTKGASLDFAEECQGQ
jgi:GH24 family phage-related lysozyme (muramidase)